MAYSLKYSGYFYNISSHKVTVDIYKSDYADSEVYNLRIQNLHILQTWEDYLVPAMGTGCEFDIVNEEYEWDFYEEMLIAEEQEFLVRITLDGNGLSDYLAFEGYLLTDVQEQQVLQRAVIHLKASNYIRQLENVKEADNVYTSAVWRVIDYIGNFLKRTNLLYDIYVNCSLYEIQMTNGRLVDDLYLHKHLFIDNSDTLEYKSLLDSLNTILKPFNMYVYGFNEKWFIERYTDLHHPNSDDTYNDVTYNVYDITTFTYTGTEVVSKPILVPSNMPSDINKYCYVDTSQTLQYSLGYKKVRLLLPTKEDHNYVNEYFGDAGKVSFTGPLTGEMFEAGTAIERWYYAQGRISDEGGAIEYDTDLIQYLNPGGESWSKYYGIAAQFLLRGTENGKLTVNIKFRRQFDSVEEAAFTTDESAFMEDMQYAGCLVYFVFMIRIKGQWYSFTKTTEGWVLSDAFLWSVSPIAIYAIGGTGGTGGMVPHRIWKYDKEENYHYWEFEESISLDENSGIIPNTSLQFPDIFKEDCIAEIRLTTSKSSWRGSPNLYTHIVSNPLYRKIRVTASYDEENNGDEEIEGVVSANYFSEYETSIDLYNHDNHNAANTIWINSPSMNNPVYPTSWLDVRTANESTTLRDLTLQEHLLEDIFQFFNKPRKKLVTTIRYDSVIAPFTFFKDSNITRNGTPLDLLLLSYKWDVNSMQYDIEAEEWVDDEGYRLVNGEMVSPVDNETSSAESSDVETDDSTTLDVTDFGRILSRANGQQIALLWAYAEYYNSVTLQSRFGLISIYSVPMSTQLLIFTGMAMPAVGNNNYGYFIIQHPWLGTLPLSILNLDCLANETITHLFVHDGTNIWKITVESEFINGDTDGFYTFDLTHVCSALIEGVSLSTGLTMQLPLQ